MDLIRAQEAIEDILECSVCMNSFETTGPRTPKMLPCQHSFCFDCMKSMFDRNRVSCPSCREVFDTRLDDIPNSFILLQLLDFRQPDEKSTDIKCEWCENRGKNIKSHCTDCIQEIMDGRVLKQAPQKASKPRDRISKSLRPGIMERMSRILTITLNDHLLIATSLCFITGVIFSMHYSSILRFSFKIFNIFVKNLIILCKVIIKFLPEVFKFLKIVFFHILNALYIVFVEILGFLPRFFEIFSNVVNSVWSTFVLYMEFLLKLFLD